MANPSGAYGFRLYRRNAGPTPAMQYCVLNGTVSIGDPLVWSSGLGVAHTAAAAQKIFGIAQANGTAGQRIPYVPVMETDVWAANTDGTTVVAQANLGVVYELGGTTGVFYVNCQGTSNPIVRIVDFMPPPHDGSALGVYAQVLVEFVADAYGRSGTVTN